MQSPEPAGIDGDALVGRRVHMLMWDQKVTQVQLGGRIGMDQSSLGKRLRGERGWTVDQLLTMARVFNTTVSYLVGETDEVRPEGFEPPTFCSVVEADVIVGPWAALHDDLAVNA